ncbi:hypothetical protein [Kitasatospora sp. NPDC057015]|uniref:hypothetical protein n=1 Tax=Kitasatospora sp. NPDC057015 TaxID=3346001 RepID=UPI00363A7C6C
MGFTVELVRPLPKPTGTDRRRGRGKAAPRDEILDRFFEDGEIWRAVWRLGPDRFPTLFRLDSHSSHVFDAYWVELMLAEVDRIQDMEVTADESEVFTGLRAMGRSCLLDRSLVMRFTGD